ncbi:MFS transporter [Streptomyces sp. FIT100]|uniref:MFS transporter n=1 Tax=Streptomyces sp. FIT100 TaxID=2837956 RepID=UPI0021C7F7B2|nr:MFS transporter [Streptomyces sp. FIT100]UUN28262.1 MFS transporter [Streptomyces sp. FIT100]
MLTSSSCPPARPHPGVRRLERTLYAYAGLEDFVLLYPVYALLFAEHGLSTAEISFLFALWSLTGLVLEVPSGVWADAVSRRLLVTAGPLLSAAGFALWVLVPSYGAFAAGFVLWGIGGSLRSGAMEALVHDELERLGAAARYARVMGRAAAASIVATAAATAAAAPAHALGGHRLLGAASVAACLLCAAAGALLPEHRAPRAEHEPEPAAEPEPEPSPEREPEPEPKPEREPKPKPKPKPEPASAAEPEPESAAEHEPEPTAEPEPELKPEPQPEPQSEHEPEPESAAEPEAEPEPERAAARRGAYAATLRAGLAEVRGSRPVRHTLLLSVVLTSVWGALDEYVPLLAAATGVAGPAVPLLVLVVWAGVTAGSLLAGPGERLSARALGVAVAGAAAVMAAGALSGRPAGLVLVGAGFLVFQLADVLADARLQAAITGPSRATVTSLAGLGTGAGTILVYGAYATLSAHAPHGTVFALLALPYLAVAVTWGRTRQSPPSVAGPLAGG